MANDITQTARSKSDMITQIKLRWSVIRTFAEWLSIKEESFDLPESEDIHRLHVTFIREGYRWLKDVYEKEFAAFHKVWKLIPPKQWHTYIMMGDMDDLQEMILMKKVKFNLRAEVVGRNRPDFFKKGKLNGQIKKKLKEAGATK